MAFIYNWARMSGALASNDLVQVTNVSDTSMSIYGTNKLLEGKYLVASVDGAETSFSGGGTINLGGHDLVIADGGTLDLNDTSLVIAGSVSFGGTFQTDGNVDISSATLTMGGQTVTLTSSATLDLGGATLSVSGSTLAIDGTPIPSYDPNGTLDLGGSTMTGDGAGTLTFDGNAVDTAKVIEGTPTDGRIGEFSGTDLVGSTVAKAGAGVLTLSAAAAQTLTVNSGGTLALDANVFTLGSSGSYDPQTHTLTLSGGDATLSLGGRTLTVTSGNVTLAGGGSLTLNNQNNAFTGSGTLDLGVSNTLAIKTGNVTVNGGGTINLAGFTATVTKSGTVAMIDDIPADLSSTTFLNIDVTDVSYAGATYGTIGYGYWRGSAFGAKTAVPMNIQWRQTGTGTGSSKLLHGSTVLYEGSDSTSNKTVLVNTTINLPGTDGVLMWQVKEDGSMTVYPHFCQLEVDL